MAFDVYVGTMTRYYRRDWENIAQRICREHGHHYEIIHSGGKPGPPPSADDVRAVIIAWRDALNASLTAHGCPALSWDEDDAQPYVTDRPGWDGYSALLVWAAHDEHPDLPLPDVAPNWTDDEAFVRSTGKGFRSRYFTIVEPQVWLPGSFEAAFRARAPASDHAIHMGSVFRLRAELDALYAATANKLKELMAATPRAPVRPGKKPGLFGRLLGRKANYQEAPATLAEAAEHSLRVFRELAEQACTHRLPMMLDY